MNRKGFAISGIVYAVLVLFLILIFSVLGLLSSRKLILDKLKNEVINDLNGELSSKVYVDNSGANYPKLADKMIPAIYDDTKNKWVYADIYEKWYDYDTKMWANAIVLKNGVTKAVGQEISEDEIALMYVWIPRYKYVLFNANNGTATEQEIRIVFEKDKNTTGTVRCEDAINQTDSSGNKISEICTDLVNGTITNGLSTYTHPAFTFGDEELTGIWVGKFENSTNDATCLANATEENCNKGGHIIEIKPNVDALRSINVSNTFYAIRDIENNYNLSEIDSHLMKNMEWGAMAYLSNSKYGRCTNGTCFEIAINNVMDVANNSVTRTGCAAGSNTAITPTCSNQYNTTIGQTASTTGNIYGIYDTNGGTREFTMGNMVDINGNFNNQKAGFAERIDSKYYDKYSYDTSSSSYTRGKLGDSSKEILKSTTNLSGWYDNYHIYFINSNPWSDYGGTIYLNSSQKNGIFTKQYASGGIGATRGSRSVLTIEGKN